MSIIEVISEVIQISKVIKKTEEAQEERIRVYFRGYEQAWPSIREHSTVLRRRNTTKEELMTILGKSLCIFNVQCFEHAVILYLLCTDN